MFRFRSLCGVESKGCVTPPAEGGKDQGHQLWQSSHKPGCWSHFHSHQGKQCRCCCHRSVWLTYLLTQLTITSYRHVGFAQFALSAYAIIPKKNRSQVHLLVLTIPPLHTKCSRGKTGERGVKGSLLLWGLGSTSVYL